MSNDKYFVILNTQSGSITHMSTGDYNDLAVFDSLDDAIKAARNNILGKNFGFMVINDSGGAEHYE